MTQTAEQTATVEAAQFTASQRDLIEALKTAALAVPSRPPLPVMGGVIADAQGSTLVLRTFDYNVSVSVTVPADPGSAGISLLGHTELQKVVAAAVAGESKAAADRTRITVTGDVLSTPEVSAPVTMLPIEEYPALPQAARPTVTVEGPEFFRQLARVLPAAGTDDTLPNLTAVRMELSGGMLRMVATDRYRIAVAEVPTQAWHETAETPEAPTRALVPADVLALVTKRLGKYTGPIALGMRTDAHGAQQVTLTIGETELTIRSNDSDDFPQWRILMPTERVAAVTADRAGMVKAAKKAAALGKAKGGNGMAVRLDWHPDGRMTLAPQLGEDEQAKVRGATVPADTTSAEPARLHGRTLALNARYLLEALDAFAGDSVTLHLSAVEREQVTKPVLLTDGQEITGDRYRHVLMPVRL